MEPLMIMIASRKMEGKWEGAVIHNGRFIKAFVDKDLLKSVTSRLAGILTSDKPEDTEITIEIRITPPSEKKEEGEKKDEQGKT